MNTPILITAYNRYKTVKKSFESLLNSDLPPNVNIIITDDGSSEPDLLKYYNEFIDIENITVRHNPHYGLPDGKIGWYKTVLKDYEGKYFIITDSDMIYSKHWVIALQNLYLKLKNDGLKPALVTGFDTHSNEHAPIKYENYYSIKNTVGGANLLVDMEFYRAYPFGHYKCIGNRKSWEWDWSMSDNAINNGWLIASTLKSIVQHIGYTGVWSKDLSTDLANQFIGENKDSVIELSLQLDQKQLYE